MYSRAMVRFPHLETNCSTSLATNWHAGTSSPGLSVSASILSSTMGARPSGGRREDDSRMVSMRNLYAASSTSPARAIMTKNWSTRPALVSSPML